MLKRISIMVDPREWVKFQKKAKRAKISASLLLRQIIHSEISK